VALLAAQDPKAAAEELTRAVTERGAVAGVLPTFIPQRPDFGDCWYDPIYAAAERLGVGVAFTRERRLNHWAGSASGNFFRLTRSIIRQNR
jgi:predicted TIM-barrel fold metal-dependent hydrolase